MLLRLLHVSPEAQGFDAGPQRGARRARLHDATDGANLANRLRGRDVQAALFRPGRQLEQSEYTSATQE